MRHMALFHKAMPPCPPTMGFDGLQVEMLFFLLTPSEPSALKYLIQTHFSLRSLTHFIKLIFPLHLEFCMLLFFLFFKHVLSIG